MKIKNVAIKNFRGYSDEINSDFDLSILALPCKRRAQLWLGPSLNYERQTFDFHTCYIPT